VFREGRVCGEAFDAALVALPDAWVARLSVQKKVGDPVVAGRAQESVAGADGVSGAPTLLRDRVDAVSSHTAAEAARAE